MHRIILYMIFKTPTRCLYMAMMLTLLNGCSQLPRQETTPLTNHAQLHRLDHWSIQGKLAIRSSSSAYNLLAHWQQRQGNFTLRLSGPLGWKPLTITSDGKKGISILRSGSLSNYDSIEALENAVPELADWGSYLVAMPHWLKGLPYDSYPIDRTDLGNEKPKFFEQRGWHIEYLRHTRVDGFLLPTKINMVRGHTQAKIIVNHWQLSTTDNE